MRDYRATDYKPALNLLGNLKKRATGSKFSFCKGASNPIGKSLIQREIRATEQAQQRRKKHYKENKLKRITQNSLILVKLDSLSLEMQMQSSLQSSLRLSKSR